MRTVLLGVLLLTVIAGYPLEGQVRHSTALPTVIADAERLSVRALPADIAPRIDGVLDEDLWKKGSPATGFLQAEPDEGRPATERTEVWVAFDADNLYIAAHLHDRAPERIVISDIRRDFRRDTQDAFEVILDTFGDRRNGYVFATNAAGARADEQVTNEGREVNTSWDAPWVVKTQRGSDGWTAEMAIPFSALRSAGGSGRWGINFSRRIRRNNEVAFWAPIPRAYELSRLSLAGDLVDLTGFSRGRGLRITPYALGRTVRETGGPEFDEAGDGGVDVKFGVTNGLTLDVTVNPDFAQVEADEQQVNLTQFSQFFPEKRDFFLENSGLFYIGDTPRNRRVATAPRGDEDLLLFFSRRMGLSSEDRRPIPIDAGVRLTGQEGGFQVGALALRTRDRDSILANDYAVVRLRRNILSNSDIGGIFMTRMGVDDRGDYNHIYGADANIRLPARIDWSSFFVNSETPGVSGPRYAFQTSLNREANFLHVKAGLLSIGENFNDELGFVRRTGVRKWSADIGIRPRYQGLREIGVREMHPHIVWNYLTDQSGDMLAKRLHTGYTFFFNDGGFSELSVNPATETLSSPFEIHPEADPIPAGRHDWTEWWLRYTSDPSRVLSVELFGILGGLWTGTQRTLRLTTTVRPSYRFWASMGLSRTEGDLGGVNGEFTREIWTFRGNYSFSTNMFIDALAQYLADGDQLNLNVRFNFIHRPLSDVFLVYNEQRYTVDGSPAPGRSLIVKVTRMFGF